MATATKKVKWLCRVSNYGFQGRYWTADEIYEFDSDVTLDKRFFERITKDTVLPVEADIEKPANTLADLRAKPFKKEPTGAEVLASQKAFPGSEGNPSADIFSGKTHPAEVPLTAKERKTIADAGESL